MIQIVAETGSTNADLISSLRGGDAPPEEGGWLIADRQSAGRGRQGRKWSDGYGNFMGSTIVRPTLHDPPAHTLALVASLALYEAVLPSLADPHVLKLKWPNDLMLRDAKLSGILLEREGDVVVIGVGVNLASAPEIPDRSTACLAELGPAPDRDSFARVFADSFAKELERWRSYGCEPICTRWLAASYPIGTDLRVHDTNGGLLTGEFGGLTEDGSLILRLANGDSRAIHAGDVFLI